MEFFKSECPKYMAMGMTYEEYWHGPADLPKYYREMYLLQREELNKQNWMLGRYIYDALIEASPMFLSLVKKREPMPYDKEPYALTAKEERRRKERDELLAQKKSAQNMKAQFELWNKAFAAKKEGDEAT